MSKKDETIEIKKTTLWAITAGIFAILFLTYLFTGGFGTKDSPDEETAISLQQPQKAVSTRQAIHINIKDTEAMVDDDPFLGDDDAPVTIIEFSDFQCPFCRKFFVQTLDSLKREYIDTGKVKFVYRDFPLNFHPMAIPAAETANCVRDKYGDDAYWKMHDKIFGEQSKQGQGTIQFSADDLKSWVEDLGYDVDECVASGKFQDEIQKDLAAGESVGVVGTPSFVINGKLVSGGQPFSTFKALIDAELAI